MARPRKEGLDYFPLDVHFDEKVKALEALHKNDGLVWIIKFWQNAYQTNSGEVSLKGIFGVIQAENCRITTGKQSEIIGNCMEIGLITLIGDEIYTSNGIQKRLNEIVKDREFERKRKLVGSYPVENKPETGESKGNKRKTNKKKENDFDFECLWQNYPKKDGKNAALRHFKASVITPEDYQDISSALDNYIEHCKKLEPKYIKNGSTWFYNWKDWINYQEPKTEVTRQQEEADLMKKLGII